MQIVTEMGAMKLFNYEQLPQKSNNFLIMKPSFYLLHHSNAIKLPLYLYSLTNMQLAFEIRVLK